MQKKNIMLEMADKQQYNHNNIVDDKNRNEDFAHKVLLKPIIYKLMIYNTSRWDLLVDWRIR